MKNLTEALLGHYAGDMTTLATCWKATLTNGTVIAATSCDRDIDFGGITYKSSQSYMPTNIESTSELNPDNLEIESFLVSPGITESDIHSGLWDYAAIEIFVVNYNDTSMGSDIHRIGTLGEVRAGRSTFVAELRGLLQAYTRTIVRLVQKDCPWDLGDSRCKVDLAPITVTGVVGAVIGNHIVNDPARTEVAEWFTGGKLTMTSGTNAGRSMEVKHSAPGMLELTHAFYEPIAPNDTYIVHAGCLKRLEEDCKVKHNNVVNFGGFPHLPGNKIYRQGGIDYGDSVASSGTGSTGGTAGSGGNGGTGSGGGTVGDPTWGDRYPAPTGALDPTQEGIFAITALDVMWGDTWYRTSDPANPWSLDPASGALSHITERRVFTMPGHVYVVGDFVSVNELPPYGFADPVKTWTANGQQVSISIHEYGISEDTNMSEYVYYHRVARVSGDQVEFWYARPVASAQELSNLLAMPSGGWDPIYGTTYQGWASRNSYKNYTTYTDGRPRSMNGQIASGVASATGVTAIWGMDATSTNHVIYPCRDYEIYAGDVWYKTTDPANPWTTDKTQGALSHITIRKRYKSWATLISAGNMIALGIMPPTSNSMYPPIKHWSSPAGKPMSYMLYEPTLDVGAAQRTFEQIVRAQDGDYFELWVAVPVSSEDEVAGYQNMPLGWDQDHWQPDSLELTLGVGDVDLTYVNPCPMSYNGVIVQAGAHHIINVFPSHSPTVDHYLGP